jgi:hypothetical protein
MERGEHSTRNLRASRKSRLPPRVCLRKHCGCRFIASSANQRYCQNPVCRREVRNWQAVKRQQKRRLRPEVRDAEAVRARTHRKRRRQQSAASVEPTVPNVPRKTPVSACASLRSTGNSGPICDRVGCYEPPRTTPQWGAAYCSDECCDEMRRVRDRERKYFWRRTEIGCIKCKAMAMKRWTARQIVPVAGPSIGSSGQAGTRAVGVHPSRPASEASVLCGDRKEVICHDVKSTEETVASQSRPPPT